MKNWKKLTAFVIALSLIALSASAEFAVVSGTSSLNLREGPGYDYSIIGNASRGDWVDVLGDTDGWYYVQVVKNSAYGYMDSAYLDYGASGSGTSYSTGVVNNPNASSFLNLREYPSYSADVLSYYYNGAVCTIISSYNGWYEVEIDGLHGYFRSEYVKVQGSSSSSYAYVTASSGSTVNMRSGPSMNFGVIDRVPIGTRVSVLLKGNNFWKIEYNGVEGYMSSSFLSTSVTPTPTVQPTTTGYCVVANLPAYASTVNMRSQPSTSAKILYQYCAGTRFEVLAQGKTWCKVYGTASGRIGYIQTQYLKLYNLPTTPTKTVQNSGSYVNLRSAPSKATGSVLLQVPHGATVTILTPGDEWTQVKYNGYTGYMMTYFLR